MISSTVAMLWNSIGVHLDPHVTECQAAERDTPEI